ncbi:FkbM family methyltransferase [Streptomyces sp. SID8366]|uniref:FkbM family methyltransferase n=1 Tax=unclassified Streptomyces TaxID=2593676 RepID=UPI000DB9D962|nr:MULTISPECIES: FkbM family methyltransferase [unclassified Streptomyces]MYU05012.1 FkbM family methyltransferase [Streptomyces sp. SID8366]MYU64183.1 FkbM family methyltransferase [Streptomyces sp. SID69]RAJ65880.1 FkbM family methyltransferase [Streptomyces sp. PsTaAH-130]
MRARRIAAVAATLRWGAHRFPFVEDEVAGLRAFVPAGSVCVDAGAEYGLYTWVLAALAGPSGRVHSVEPLPGPYRLLRSTARLLGARNVTVHRAALGDWCGSGTLSLPVRRGLPVHGRAYLTAGADGPGPNTEFRDSRTVPAPVRTLDQLAQEIALERLTFVKADVEGTELALLKGGSATLLRHRPTLLLEIERRHLAKYGADPADVLTHLRDLGYRAHCWRRGRWDPVTRITDDRRNYLFTT